jgi:EpsI family protein
MIQASWRFTAVAALLAATWAASVISAKRSPEPLAEPLESIPGQIGAWRGSADRKLDPATLSVLKPTSYLSRVYQRDNVAVDFFTAFYALQEAGETMHSPRNCLPGSGWEVWRHQTVDVTVEGKGVTLNSYGVQNGAQRMVVLYWYQTPERIVASEYYAKVCLVLDAVLRSHTSGSIVRIVAPDHPDAVKAALEFAAEIIPQVQRCLPRANS